MPSMTGRSRHGCRSAAVALACLLLLTSPPPICPYAVPTGPAGDLYRRYVVSLPDAVPCVLLVDRLGGMGCAGHGEATAPLLSVASPADLDALREAPQPTMVLLPAERLGELLGLVAATDKVSGVLVHQADNATKEEYSPAEPTPNSRFYPAQKPLVPKEWNPTGTSQLLTRFRFPMWLVADSTTYGTLLDKALENRRKDAEGAGGPRWAAQMLLNMAAGDRTAGPCLAARKCQPLGGGTTWATLRPIEGPQLQKPIVALMGSTSSTGLFHDRVPAAAAVVAHVTALLAAFDALVKMPDAPALDKEILLMLFPGEDYGYLGSSRFVRDLTEPYNCTKDGDAKSQVACRQPFLPTAEFRKLPPRHIEFLLDVSQVGAAASEGLFIHTYDGTKATARLVSLLRSFGAKPASPPRGLPPSPLLSFLQQPGLPTASGAAVLAGYESAFPTPNYAGLSDTAEAVDEAKVLRAAQVVASAAWKLAGGQTPVKVDPQLVSALLHCLLTDFRCPLVRDLFPGQTPPPRANWYVGAFQLRAEMGTPEQRFLYRFLANLTAQERAGPCKVSSDCDYRKKGLSCVAGTCMRTAAYQHQGFSPAVEWDYDDNKWRLVEGAAERFSTVTESDWPSGIGVRVFLRDGPAPERAILLGGLGTFLAAACGWAVAAPYFTRRYKLE